MMPAKAIARRLLYLTEKGVQAVRYASLQAPPDGWPILLGISFPKSGTHLLDQILVGFSKVAPFSLRLHSFYAEYEGASGQKRSEQQALDWLNALRPGDVGSAHLFSRPEVVRKVLAPDFVAYFIYRDPRDVAVSHAFYVSDMASEHVHHDYYASLPDFETRLTVSILGRPDAGVEFPNIAERFAPYATWLEHPEVMKIHFEDLVADRSTTLGAIARHLSRRAPLPLSEADIVGALEASINPERSPTFRSGKTGEWRNYFTPQHRRLFKSVAGDLLVRLGYETSDKW
jgi:hypothetical protein